VGGNWYKLLGPGGLEGGLGLKYIASPLFSSWFASWGGQKFFMGAHLFLAALQIAPDFVLLRNRNIFTLQHMVSYFSKVSF